MEGFSLKQHRDHNGEDEQRNDFLNHLQLNECKRSAIIYEADAIGWHLTNVLKEGYSPREGDNGNQGPVFTNARFAQFQMTVPSKGHKYIAQHEQEDRINT